MVMDGEAVKFMFRECFAHFTEPLDVQVNNQSTDSRVFQTGRFYSNIPK